VEWSDWIVALYCFGSAAGVIGFWIARLSAKRVAIGDAVMRHHVAAEFVTGAALLTAGIATVVRARNPISVCLVGLGLGALLYAGIQSQPFYPDEPAIRASLWGTLVTAVFVLALRLATL